MPSTSDTIYQSRTVLLRSVPSGRRDRWVVTFDNYGLGPGFDRPGFGEAFLHEEGVSALHVLGRGDDWYQYPDMLASLAAARTHLAGADRIVTYGSSMGGYGALRFAHVLGADAAIAFSPQYSNDPRVVPWERRWPDEARRIAWRRELGGSIRPIRQPILLFDPIGDDARHAALIVRDVAAAVVPLPYAGHPVTTYLSELDLLRPLLRSVLDDVFDPIAFIHAARADRRRSSTYYLGIAQRQPDIRPGLAEALARRALSVSPDSPLPRHVLGTLMSRAGRHAEALEHFVAAVRLTGRRDASYLYGEAGALVANGRTHDAVMVADEVVALMPGLARLRSWRAAILWQAGRRRAAIHAQTQAVRMSPQRLVYWQLLGGYVAALPAHALAAILAIARSCGSRSIPRAPADDLPMPRRPRGRKSRRGRCGAGATRRG